MLNTEKLCADLQERFPQWSGWIARLELEDAPCDAPTDNDVFLAYVRKVLLPSLRPGDIVVLDNLRSHKTAAVAEAIRSAGAEALYLPAYSPDLNPIEKMWSKIKATLRAIAARTSPALHRAIQQALLQVTPRDAASWFASCGYTFS